MAKVRRKKPTGKDSRLGLRLTPEQKEIVERKARARGLSASSFLVMLAIEAPEKPGGSEK